MSDTVSPEIVQKVARLARLHLSEAEVGMFAKQLGDILGYIEVLNEVDTADVEPMAHAADISNVFREDRVRPSLHRDAVLANAPKSDGEYFLVPQILDGGDA